MKIFSAEITNSSQPVASLMGALGMKQGTGTGSEAASFEAALNTASPNAAKTDSQSAGGSAGATLVVPQTDVKAGLPQDPASSGSKSQGAESDGGSTKQRPMLSDFSGSRASGRQSQKESGKNPANGSSEISIEDSMVVGGVASNLSLANLVLPQLDEAEAGSGGKVLSVELANELSVSRGAGQKQGSTGSGSELINGQRSAEISGSSGAALKGISLSVSSLETPKVAQQSPTQAQQSPTQSSETLAQGNADVSGNRETAKAPWTVGGVGSAEAGIQVKGVLTSDGVKPSGGEGAANISGAIADGTLTQDVEGAELTPLSGALKDADRVNSKDAVRSQSPRSAASASGVDVARNAEALPRLSREAFRTGRMVATASANGSLEQRQVSGGTNSPSPVSESLSGFIKVDRRSMSSEAALAVNTAKRGGTDDVASTGPFGLKGAVGGKGGGLQESSESPVADVKDFNLPENDRPSSGLVRGGESLSNLKDTASNTKVAQNEPAQSQSVREPKAVGEPLKSGIVNPGKQDIDSQSVKSDVPSFPSRHPFVRTVSSSPNDADGKSADGGENSISLGASAGRAVRSGGDRMTAGKEVPMSELSRSQPLVTGGSSKVNSPDPLRGFVETGSENEAADPEPMVPRIEVAATGKSVGNAPLSTRGGSSEMRDRTSGNILQTPAPKTQNGQQPIVGKASETVSLDGSEELAGASLVPVRASVTAASDVRGESRTTQVTAGENALPQTDGKGSSPGFSEKKGAGSPNADRFGGGTVDAQLDDGMAHTATNESYGRVFGKNIPDPAKNDMPLAVGRRGAGFVEASSVVNPRMSDLAGFSGSQAGSSVQNAMGSRSASDASAATPSRLADEVWSAVETFRTQGNRDWTVRIRPDRDTELNLRMRLQDNQLVIHARLETGRPDAIALRWNELQSVLADRGVQLQSLESGTGNSHSQNQNSQGFSQFGSDGFEQRETFEQQQQLERELASMAGSIRSRAALESAATPKQKTRVSQNHLETWA